MLLSIVTGTYNRLPSLQRMMDSVRREFPRGIAYNFIICDGGSTDGTLEYLRSLSDVVLLEHGELRGAIKAFSDAANLSTADYTVLANDDIEFKPYSLLAALAYLESDARCAAVAMADNRTSLVTGDGTEYRVEGIGALLPDGMQTMVHYAQVGVFRTELGKLAGWWGADDPIMGRARTYGGDSYLSARLWEMGYTVNAVEGAQVEDFIARDELRTYNAAVGGKDSAAYYERYPAGPHIPSIPARYPLRERLRILHLPVYEWGHPQRKNLEAGLTEALAEYGLALEIDYLNELHDLPALVRAWQPDLLITQIQNAGPSLSAYKLAMMRQAGPTMTVINWNGDAHEAGLISDEVVKILRYTDLQTTVNAKVLPLYEQLGLRAAYWQIGYKDPIEPLPEMPSYDVLCQMNCYNKVRTEMAKMLRGIRTHKRPYRFGLYGNCKDADGNTHYDFAAQAALYRNARIVVGDTYPGTEGFVSNRLFQALSQGAFMLQQHSQSLDRYTGLVPGQHYVEWTTLDDLKAKVLYYLDEERNEDRARIARCGQEFVRANFSYPAQARKLFTELIPLIGH